MAKVKPESRTHPENTNAAIVEARDRRDAIPLQKSLYDVTSGF
jgi:hypothetical protein